jgi:hypothetical protein
MDGAAIFSACGRYRYTLNRIWEPTRRTVLFVGLNPSTATAKIDDPTIRRCVRFARDWGFGSVVMANLFAYRSTCPSILPRVHDPVGPRNNWWLSFLRNRVDLVIAAWGVSGQLLARDRQVIEAFPSMHCLGLTKNGFPKHPLYLSATTEPQPFRT